MGGRGAVEGRANAGGAGTTAGQGVLGGGGGRARQNSDPSLRVPCPGPDRETGRQDAGPQRHFNHGWGGGHNSGRRTREHQANAILDWMQRESAKINTVLERLCSKQAEPVPTDPSLVAMMGVLVDSSAAADANMAVCMSALTKIVESFTAKGN
eukprot:3940721-Rhodomonas_salina.2